MDRNLLGVEVARELKDILKDLPSRLEKISVDMSLFTSLVSTPPIATIQPRLVFKAREARIRYALLLEDDCGEALPHLFPSAAKRAFDANDEDLPSAWHLLHETLRSEKDRCSRILERIRAILETWKNLQTQLEKAGKQYEKLEAKPKRWTWTSSWLPDPNPNPSGSSCTFAAATQASAVAGALEELMTDFGRLNEYLTRVMQDLPARTFEFEHRSETGEEGDQISEWASIIGQSSVRMDLTRLVRQHEFSKPLIRLPNKSRPRYP
ncbi:hypothetical protein FRB95_010960 [Tulasnella sp. JGI-2019a]|nr:hypothetical protein FRB95_010960 [Tulasnella sp. JGI-2019a]